MLFNSFQFLFFFIIVYSLYLVLNHKTQNRMLLIASYIFYGLWDWRFLFLIFFTTCVDYFCALNIEESRVAHRRKFFLAVSIVTNLSILCFFKYFNFFLENLIALLNTFGVHPNISTLNILLPVGISFYTFQSISYTVDVYRKEMKATKNFLDFVLFVAFFPQLVAGPIERAKTLIPQILTPRVLTKDKFWEGCHLIAWGLFEKMFVADNLALLVDPRDRYLDRRGHRDSGGDPYAHTALWR